MQLSRMHMGVAVQSSRLIEEPCCDTTQDAHESEMQKVSGASRGESLLMYFRWMNLVLDKLIPTTHSMSLFRLIPAEH